MLAGNPNTGKSTLFNALTGLSQRVGNYPGVTVEQKSGELQLPGGVTATLVDLPGSYSLAAHAPDEMIVVDVLLGQQEGSPTVDAVIVIADASNLDRNLFLVSQVLELRLPTVLALNMVDVAQSRSVHIDAEKLHQDLGIPVVLTCAHRNEGMDELRESISDILTSGRIVEQSKLPQFPESLTLQVNQLSEKLNATGIHRPVSKFEAFRALVDQDGYAEQRLIAEQGEEIAELLAVARDVASSEEELSQVESIARYAWIETLLSDSVSRPETVRASRSDQIDRVLLHRLVGTAFFIALMAVVFQAIFSWAVPIMDGIDEIFGYLGSAVGRLIPEGAFQSLIVDGVIAGVGSVVIFLPQIAMLFLFLSILEDCGYISRAAFLMDRLLTRCGLSGLSFIPLLSSFACAVPGIMATRTIADRRDRFTTLLVAPLMSCSARLPVYTLLIAAFIPNEYILGGWLGLQGLALLGLYALGTLVAIAMAWLLKKTMFKGESPPFILELPSYKWPSAKTVGLRVYGSARTFLVDAGTIILAAAIVMWALAYFPRSEEVQERYESRRNEISASEQDGEAALKALDAEEAGEMVAHSFLGRMGKVLEPAVRPLGWDWRIGMAAIASFPAREIIVASLATIYSLGTDVDETSESLQDVLRSAKWDDGRPVYNVPVALSIMVFFALCAQCTATLAMIKREASSWKWPAFTFVYMTVLAYVGALIVYQVTTAIGWGG